MNTPPPAHGAQKLNINSTSALNKLAKASKQYSVSSPKYIAFPIISAISTYYLWVVMGSNGAADALQATLATGRYADGTVLSASYTGIRPLDQLIAVIVAFEHPVTTGEDKP